MLRLPAINSYVLQVQFFFFSQDIFKRVKSSDFYMHLRSVQLCCGAPAVNCPSQDVLHITSHVLFCVCMHVPLTSACSFFALLCASFIYKRALILMI